MAVVAPTYKFALVIAMLEAIARLLRWLVTTPQGQVLSAMAAVAAGWSYRERKREQRAFQEQLDERKREHRRRIEQLDLGLIAIRDELRRRGGERRVRARLDGPAGAAKRLRVLISGGGDESDLDAISEIAAKMGLEEVELRDEAGGARVRRIPRM